MSARTDLTAALTEGLGDGYRVEPTFEAVANADVPVILVSRARVAPSDLIQRRTDSLAVWLLTPETDPIRAEADLDTHLDAVLDILDKLPELTFETAERTTFEEAFHAYRITCQTDTPKES